MNLPHTHNTRSRKTGSAEVYFYCARLGLVQVWADISPWSAAGISLGWTQWKKGEIETPRILLRRVIMYVFVVVISVGWWSINTQT